MSKRAASFLGLFILFLPVSFAFSAETWHLGKGEDWEAVSVEGGDRYLLAVAEVKRLVSEGQSGAVGEALNKLKKDFPEIAGPDLDAFFEAEMLFSAGKYSGANRGYEKFLEKYPDSELYDAALERQYSIGTAFLAGERRRVLGIFNIRGYAVGAKIMEGISERAGESPIGLKAVSSMARSYERRGKFSEAYYKWSEISLRWPGGRSGKESLVGMARCKHAGYKGPKYDVSDLISAESYYGSFESRYPEDAREIDVGGILKQIEEQLAYKQFSIGEYYQKTGNMQAANLYYQMVLDKWSGSTAAKLARAESEAGSIKPEKVKR